MNIYISRDGQERGPYPIESLAEMIHYGGVQPDDLIRAEGESKYVPVSAFLDSQAPQAGFSPATVSPPALRVPPPVQSVPPPIPAGPPPLGASSLANVAELEDSILAGGRFVLFQYCFSVIVVTFRCSSPILFLRGNEDGFKHAFGYSLISLTAGWWGFPWGPIRTVTTLFNNARGGKDVTREVLSEKIGPARTADILARRSPPPPRGNAFRLFRWALVGAPVLLVSLLAGPLAFVAFRADDLPRSHAPGEVEFRAANDQIIRHRDQVAFGNSPKAIAVAATVSRNLKAWRDELIQSGKKDYQFPIFCELTETQCALLVHVPELRHFTSDAKVVLGKLAWLSAQAALQQHDAGQPGMALAIGVRGVAFYDRVLLGFYEPDDSSGQNSLVETVTDIENRQQLYKFFAAPARESGAIPDGP